MTYRFLTTLAHDLRAGGLKVVELDGWQTRGRPASTGNFAPVGVLWHHTGPGVSGLKGAQWMAREGRPDLPAPLCQLSIDRDGTVYVLAAGRANHAGKAKSSGTVAAGDGNALYVGVECMNSGTEKWSVPQYSAMVKTGVVLAKLLGTSVNAQRGHKETSVTGKWDPGALDMDKLRADIAAAIKAKTSVKARAVAKLPKKKAKKKQVRSVGNLSIVQANFLKSNKHPDADVGVLAKTRAHVIGINEGRNFLKNLGRATGYRLVAPGAGAALNNPILLRRDLTWIEQGTRKMCDKVGSSPDRHATWVGYTHLGKRAHVQTHANAHIEDGGKPRPLPRVAQNVRHLANLSALVKELRAKGYKVTVGGDFNWAWKLGPAWVSAPGLVFRRLRMYVNWANVKTAPEGGTLGSRRIDYLAHSGDLRIAGQHIVKGEHSDHRWLQVDYKVIG